MWSTQSRNKWFECFYIELYLLTEKNDLEFSVYHTQIMALSSIIWIAEIGPTMY